MKLQRDAEVESDDTLPILIRIQRIVEDACDTYRLDRVSGCQARLHTHAARLSDDLEECMSALLPERRNKGRRPRLYAFCYH